jgi:hypothetical protein
MQLSCGMFPTVLLAEPEKAEWYCCINNQSEWFDFFTNQINKSELSL